ncbi:MAG: M3 family oligoendopeptidase, partial [Chloroflexi bacterium]|nr:M3 family oligoendopeptidase [Chloroflexota bacterium]
MYTVLPQTSAAFEALSWAEIEPWYAELTATELSQETLRPWLLQWSRLSELVDETLRWLEIICTQNTADQERALRRQRFLNDIYTPVQTFDQRIIQQLLASGLEPEGFAIPLRNLRVESELFREANLPLLNKDKHLGVEYNTICGARIVPWEGKEVSITSLRPVLASPDRELRESAWRVTQDRRLADRERLNAIWVEMVQVRQQIAHNAGYESYRDYRWRQMLRFNYTPADCKAFHEAVEQVIVPAVSHLLEERRQVLNIETIRPWDINVNPWTNEPPRLISDVDALLTQCATVFRLIDPTLGGYFETMIREQLLDLEDRPFKAHIGYNLPLEVRKRPFIFGLVTSVRDIVPLIFHEAGHAFHVFEMGHLPYLHQRKEEALPVEFAEVASTSMELIGSMHLHSAGLCTEAEAAQLRLPHLETLLWLMLQSVAGDAFQHWVYEHPEQAMNPDACDQKWAELYRRYYPGVDWHDLEAALKIGWQQIPHFFGTPFYYIEYAFA